MSGRLRRARAFLRSVLREIRSEEISFMAGSVAYHAFVSLLPILLLLTVLVSVVGMEELSSRILALAGSFLPRTGERIVADAVRNADDAVGVSLVGAVVLVWGTFKIFRALDAAFSEIYDVSRDDSLLDQARDAAVVFFALVVAILVASAVGSLFRVPPHVPFSGLLDGLVATTGLALAFFPMYYVFPDVDVTVREVVPGVVVAAVGWTSLQWLFRLYVQVSSKPDVYGFVGAILLLVTWLYVGAFALLLGGSVNATLAGRTRNRAARAGSELGKADDAPEDAVDFERELVGLIAEARDADVPTGEIRRTLRQQAARVERWRRESRSE